MTPETDSQTATRLGISLEQYHGTVALESEPKRNLDYEYAPNVIAALELDRDQLQNRVKEADADNQNMTAYISELRERVKALEAALTVAHNALCEVTPWLAANRTSDDTFNRNQGLLVAARMAAKSALATGSK